MALRPWMRKAAVVVASLTLLMVGCNVSWRVRNPAPLGRSEAEITARLASDLPPGTSKDSVINYLSAKKLGHSAFDSAGVITSAMRHVIPPAAFPGSVYLIFSFDEMKRLKKTEINVTSGMF